MTKTIPHHEAATPALHIQDLVVRYGGIMAVKDVSLSVGMHETVALIGANGAGKTSILRAVTGLVPRAAGEVHFFGESLAARQGHELPGLGLVMVPEGRGIFSRMTILENLRMGGHSRKDSSRADLEADIEAQLQRFPRLRERAHQLAGTLSGGEQQMLALSRALVARPRLLLLDEPSMGLAPIMVDRVFEVIREVAASGTAILLVEQNARLALQTASRGYVLESGSLVQDGPANALLESPAIRAAYLGE